MGAYELRNGVPKVEGVSTASADMVAAMNPELLLDYMGVRLNGPAAVGKHTTLNWQQPDGKVFGLELRNGVLIYSADRPHAKPDATLQIDKLGFAELLLGGARLDQLTGANKATVLGDRAQVEQLFGLLQAFNPMFPIAAPDTER